MPSAEAASHSKLRSGLPRRPPALPGSRRKPPLPALPCPKSEGASAAGAPCRTETAWAAATFHFILSAQNTEFSWGRAADLLFSLQTPRCSTSGSRPPARRVLPSDNPRIPQACAQVQPFSCLHFSFSDRISRRQSPGTPVTGRERQRKGRRSQRASPSESHLPPSHLSPGSPPGTADQRGRSGAACTSGYPDPPSRRESRKTAGCGRKRSVFSAGYPLFCRKRTGSALSGPLHRGGWNLLRGEHGPGG